MPRSARKESGYGIYHVMMFSHHADDPKVGLSLNEDLGKYKMFLNDTGLFITLAFWDKDVTENEIYAKLLSDKLSANLGYVYENIVAQMCLCLLMNRRRS